MNPDCSSEECITDNIDKFASKHNGNPTWHPSGKWIIFQSVDVDLIPPSIPKSEIRILTGPGAGWLNNLWIMDNNNLQN